MAAASARPASSRWRLSPLPITLRLTRDQLIRYTCDPWQKSAPKQAEARGTRLEGATRADAMLLAPATGVAVIFEAKVLSDISTRVTFDLARNQLARSIDVMLEANPALTAPLNLRKPERTFLVLLTPALTQPGRAGDAISKSRLYGWLMPAYKDPDSSLLRQHLPHRDGSELAEAAERLGWASWEDCHSVAPGACSWLTATPGTG